MAGLGPCPLAGQLLADLGASVTVIDRESEPVDLTDVNRRGKRSIALNLKTEAGHGIAAQLIDQADVLIEGFRPGVMERLNLGSDICCQRNPRLVFARVTGWGQTGPLAHVAGHDINYLAITGALAGIGTQASGPLPPLNLAADYAGGTMFLVFGVLSALYERQSSGKGQVVDAAMCDGVPAMMGLLYQWFAQGEWNLQRESNLLDGASPFYRCYQTSDAQFMSVGALEPQFFKLLVERLALPEKLLAEQYDRDVWPQHTQLISAAFLNHTQAHWVLHFEGSDACVAPVLTMEDAPTHPHNQQRNIFTAKHGVMQSSTAPRFSRSSVTDVASPGAKGGDTHAILSEIGLGAEDIQLLGKSGALT